MPAALPSPRPSVDMVLPPLSPGPMQVSLGWANLLTSVAQPSPGSRKWLFFPADLRKKALPPSSPASFTPTGRPGQVAGVVKIAQPLFGGLGLNAGAAKDPLGDSPRWASVSLSVKLVS